MTLTPVLRRPCRALACGGALLGALAPATAHATATAPASPSIHPVPASHFRPVRVDVTLVDAGGGVLERRSCGWEAEPAADDRPCLAFQSDPWSAIAAISAAGAVRGVSRTQDPTRGEELTLAVSQRADGTWLVRATGRAAGREQHFGRVCDARARACERWDADGAHRAAADIRAAGTRLRRAS